MRLICIVLLTICLRAEASSAKGDSGGFLDAEDPLQDSREETQVIHLVTSPVKMGVSSELSGPPKALASGPSPADPPLEPSDSTARYIDQIELDDVKKMLGVDKLDTKKIEEYLAKHPSVVFPDPAIGDLWTHFFNTGLLKELAALYARAPQSSPAIISAISNMRMKVGEVIAAITGGGFFSSLISKSPTIERIAAIVRNIEYLIGAFSFLDKRPQFRLLSDQSETAQSLLDESLKLFSMMLDNVIEPGMPADNVGVTYTEFTSCTVPYVLKMPQGRIARLLSRNAPGKKLMASNPNLVIAFMAIEAIAEEFSPRPSDVTPSDFDQFLAKINTASALFGKGCNDELNTKSHAFSAKVLSENFTALKSNWKTSFETLTAR